MYAECYPLTSALQLVFFHSGFKKKLRRVFFVPVNRPGWTPRRPRVAGTLHCSTGFAVELLAVGVRRRAHVRLVQSGMAAVCVRGGSAAEEQEKQSGRHVLAGEQGSAGSGMRL